MPPAKFAGGRCFEWRRLVAVGVRFVGAVFGDADVVRLLVGQNGQLGADLVEVKSGDLFVEFLGKGVDIHFVDFSILPEVDLCESLV